MTVEGLLATLRARGVTLVAAGDRLRFRPVALITAEEQAALGRDRDAVIAHLRAEEEGTVADAIEVVGAWVVYRTPPGLRCGRCCAAEWRPVPGVRGEIICAGCWSADAKTLRPYEEIAPPAPCPTCGGPAWRVYGTWRCARCEPLAPARRNAEPPPENECEAVHWLAAAAGFPRTPLAPAVAVLPGATAWQRFVATAHAEELAAARATLEGLPAPEEEADAREAPR